MEQSLTETLNVLISEKYLNENDVDGIFSNQKVMDLIHKEESPSDKGYNSNNCHARVWKNGFDNIQCNCLKMDGEDYCLTHCKRVKEKGEWWLGKITEVKPKQPIYYDGTIHYWKTDEIIEREEMIQSEKKVELNPETSVKRKRGRPKGSKNKKKKEKNMSELTKKDILLLLKEKSEKDTKKETIQNVLKKEIKSENIINETSENIYMVDNVPYELDGNNIMDPYDYSPMGTKNGQGGIDFEDEDAENKHKENIDKYKK